MLEKRNINYMIRERFQMNGRVVEKRKIIDTGLELELEPDKEYNMMKI